MREKFNLNNEKGSITVFVLVALLFMSSFLIISYASNANKSKVVKDQLNTIKGIYSKNENIVDSYYETYTFLRNKNKQIMTSYVEASNIIELTKTFEEELKNYRIYGCEEKVGDLISDDTDVNNGKYKISIKINEKNYIDRDNYSKISTSDIINEFNNYYEVSTRYNSNGICFKIDGDFKVGDKINAQAKVLYISSQDETANDAVTLRIRNITQKKYIHSGMNGKETECSTITIGEEKILKLSEVELTSDNYSEGDIIGFYITRGIGSSKLQDNTIKFYVYKDSVSFEKSNESEIYANSKTYNIFLDNPLDDGDYLDFEKGKVIRSDGIEEEIDLPHILFAEDYTKMKVVTAVKPSKIEVEYWGYTLE